MQTDTISLTALGPLHLDGALRLSRAAGWPHRDADWQMSLALGQGVAAVDAAGVVVGTILVTPYRSSAATINMVIVDEALRGRGLGRRLMEAALDLAGNRPLRLVATQEGLPLYEKLGFAAVGSIAQFQGVAGEVAPPSGLRAATAQDMAAIYHLDRQATGADREGLIAYIANVGSFVVLARAGAIVGFAGLRCFGRGEVIGPVVAENAADARRLIAHFLAARSGAFLRIDTGADAELAAFLAQHGLTRVGGGIVMQRPVAAPAPQSVHVFALASQAFG
ncbi:GNAT family N-acetyltransferase [Oryzibacter oryziterrae]|uniref:GNAT family N-acetyltransferase n=1 Tax=Oryzibacter oryziterrae TaxID=2766474 RepID=UPI001F01DB84|nr:GNAT family N-acetyltransferase [Oryzibacter oryziterrae]